MNLCQTESNFKFKWSEHTQVDSTCTCMCSCVNRMITVKTWMCWIFQLFPSQWLHLRGFQGKRHIQGRPERGIEGMQPHDPVSPGQARAFASDDWFDRCGWLVPGSSSNKAVWKNSNPAPPQGQEMSPSAIFLRRVHASHGWSIPYCTGWGTGSQAWNSLTWAVVTAVPRVTSAVCKIKVLCRMWSCTAKKSVGICICIHTCMYVYMLSYIYLCIYICIYIIHYL